MRIKSIYTCRHISTDLHNLMPAAHLLDPNSSSRSGLESTSTVMNSRVVFLIFLYLHFVSTAHAFTVSGVFAMGILGQNKAAILKNGACFLPRRNVAVAPKMSPPYHLLAPIENDFFLVTLFGTLIPSVLLITLYMKSSARSAVDPTSDWGYIYLSSYVLYIRYCMCALEQ